MTCFRAWCAGIQSDYMAEQYMTFLVDYVSNVWQAGSVSYVDVEETVEHLILQCLSHDQIQQQM